MGVPYIRLPILAIEEAVDVTFCHRAATKDLDYIIFRN
jgi:hypothetical protein